ncbi:MAG: DUF4412 domain-containing protein [Bacteroidetes bacterium]|nr:DUF4412 domain-containing protein [Bacteroidota bacterium]
MKRNLVLLLMAAVVTLNAQKGVILEQKMTAKNLPGKTISVTWLVTNTSCKLKMQFPEAKGVSHFIPDLKAGMLYTYNDGPTPDGVKKSFFAASLDKIQSSNETAVSRIVVKQTGETKDIGGFKCEKIIASTSKGDTEMWVTKDFKPEFYKYEAFFKSNWEMMALREERIKGLPLSSVTKDAAGNVLNAYEFVSITSTDISETEFSVPAAYSQY